MRSTSAGDFAPPPLRRIASAPARPQAASVDKAALARSIVQLERRVLLLAAESRHPDLIAVAKQHSVDGLSDDGWYDDMVLGTGRRVMKRGARAHHKGGHSMGGREHPGGGGGPTSVRASRAAPAVRYRTTVGDRTIHYAVVEPSVGKRYERKEWHKALHMQRPFLTRQEQRWREEEEVCERALRDLGIDPTLAHRKRDVVAASEVRCVPPQGEMACDSDLDPAALATALPDDVLSKICKEHARAHATVRAGRGSEADRPRPIEAPTAREIRQAHNVQRARRTQWRREMQRK
jgi:hypothetical protein